MTIDTLSVTLLLMDKQYARIVPCLGLCQPYQLQNNLFSDFSIRIKYLQEEKRRGNIWLNLIHKIKFEVNCIRFILLL